MTDEQPGWPFDDLNWEVTPETAHQLLEGLNAVTDLSERGGPLVARALVRLRYALEDAGPAGLPFSAVEMVLGLDGDDLRTWLLSRAIADLLALSIADDRLRIL